MSEYRISFDLLYLWFFKWKFPTNAHTNSRFILILFYRRTTKNLFWLWTHPEWFMQIIRWIKRNSMTAAGFKQKIDKKNSLKSTKKAWMKQETFACAPSKRRRKKNKKNEENFSNPFIQLCSIGCNRIQLSKQ